MRRRCSAAAVAVVAAGFWPVAVGVMAAEAEFLVAGRAPFVEVEGTFVGVAGTFVGMTLMAGVGTPGDMVASAVWAGTVAERTQAAKAGVLAAVASVVVGWRAFVVVSFWGTANVPSEAVLVVVMVVVLVVSSVILKTALLQMR